MSGERVSPSEQRALEQQWLTERFQGICMSDFGDSRFRFYLTADLTMPEHFDGHYHVCTTKPNSRFQLSSQEGSEVDKADSLFAFCNHEDPAQLTILEDLANEIDLRGTEAPPLFLILHSHYRHKDHNKEMATFALGLLRAGVDGIISDAASGHLLVWETRLILGKSRRLSSYFSNLMQKHHAEAKRAQMLADCIEVMMWGYLRGRIVPSVPALDVSLIGSHGKHMIPGFGLGRRLGEGMSGAVYQLRSKGFASGSVLKMHPKSSFKSVTDMRILKRTIAMSKMLSNGACAHPSIAKLHEILHSPTHILLRLEDAGPENLYQYLVEKPLPAKNAKSILSQALTVVHHLHYKSICHRDLKPENFIACDEKDGVTLKLVDFDMAVEVKSGMMCFSSCGTIPFAAPEVLLDQEYDGFQADIWSLGLVMCEVLLGVRSLENKLRLTKVTPLQGEKKGQAVARVIRDYFKVPGVVLEFAGEKCRCEFRHFLTVCVPILTGTLRVQAHYRWDASMCYHKFLEL